MPDWLQPFVAFVLAIVFERVRYGRQIGQLAKDALDRTKNTPLDKYVPEGARKIVEQAVILANQKLIDERVAKLEKLEDQGRIEAAEAYERGKRLGEGFIVERVEPTGDEPTTKPFEK